MPRAKRKIESTSDEARRPSLRSALADDVSIASPVASQHMALEEAFSPDPAGGEVKYPLALRAAILVGGSILLWSGLIGASLVAIRDLGHG